MIHFPNLILHRYTYTDEGVGIYGESVKKYIYADDIPVDFQNETNKEISNQYGVDLQNLYKIYFDINLTVSDNDKFKDDNGNEYHVIGNIKNYNHFLNYRKAHLVLERGGAYGR